MTKRYGSVKIGTLLSVTIGILFVVAAAIIVALVNSNMRQQALAEAEAKMHLMLDRNLAIHTYFSKILKPNLFEYSEPFLSEDFFDPSWMSSSYAVREMGNYFKTFSLTDYYYKDATINARNPENEADAEERAFIEELNTNPLLTERSSVRTIDGKPYLVVLRPGETLEESCLRCHGEPKDAPGDLVRLYGSEHSFHREAELGNVISAVSVRVPLAVAYAEVDRVSLQLSILLVALLGLLFIIQFWLSRRLVFAPMKMLRDKARQISAHTEHLGEQIPEPFGEELGELTGAFNAMSVNLRETQEKLVRHEKLAVLGQMAGSVGHELRNPLAVINNALYYLKLVGTDSSEKVKEYLGIIETETQTAEKIITDLLDFARIKSVDLESVSVSELIHQTLERFPTSASVQVTLEIPEDLAKLYVDPRQIEQVLGNLVVNACQSMSAGGDLIITAHQEQEMIAIAVKDTGVGIPPENMKKLFEPLFTTKAKGIGLGLAVSQKLAEANGGRIEVQSEAGKGSTFKLVLPVHNG